MLRLVERHTAQVTNPVTTNRQRTDLVELQHGAWHHPAWVESRTLADDHPDLAHSPLLRGALLTLHYAQEHGSIGLTRTKAFKRTFVHWAVENFDWPGKSAEEMFRYNKVIDEFEFPPLELLHFLLISLRLGRHFKGKFRPTRRGAELAQGPGQVFAELIPYIVQQSRSTPSMPPAAIPRGSTRPNRVLLPPAV